MEQDGGDMEVDQCLIGKFSSMGTTDKDVLVNQFCNLIGSQLEHQACEFFLEMNNWNLQAAIGSYYDYKSPHTQSPQQLQVMSQPQMAFVRDVTIGEGESVPPDTEFLKTWRIQNTGNESWPGSCTLRFVNGERMNSPDWIAVGTLNAKDITNISVKMKSPAQPGIYQGQWRMFNQSLVPFGDVIWVIITVEAGGLLGVTQQMSKLSGHNNHNNNMMSYNNSNITSSQHHNPFQSAHHQNPFDNSTTTSNGNRDDIMTSSSCWAQRSPTTSQHVDDVLRSTEPHQLDVISEEPTVMTSYRQVSPTGSPRRMLMIERTLASPDAPSPIKPERSSVLFSPNSPRSRTNATSSSTASQRLDFTSTTTSPFSHDGTNTTGL